MFYSIRYRSRMIVQTIAYIAIAILITFIDPSSSQRARNAAITRCTHYKQLIFEKNSSFAPLTYDAPETVIPTNYCFRVFPYVVGGTEAGSREFPQAARLGSRSSSSAAPHWFCGGTLISNLYVLTAAHCLYSTVGAVNIVRLGELDFNSTTDDAQPEDFAVKRTIDHPNHDWESPSEYNDIALIELDRPVKLNEYKLPACLPVKSGDEDNYFLAVGWGLTRFTGNHSSILQKVGLTRFNYTRCANFTNRSGLLDKGLDNSSQICAGSEYEKDTCEGDSGGPLFAFHPDYPCMLTVVGVTSFGITGGCATPGYPAVYTRVNHYLDWIYSIAFS